MTDRDAQCDSNQLIKEAMIGAHSPELKIPIMQFEIAIDPLRHSVSHLPAHYRDNTLPPKCGILQFDCLIRGRVHRDSSQMKHFVCGMSLVPWKSPLKTQIVVVLSVRHNGNRLDCNVRFGFM